MAWILGILIVVCTVLWAQRRSRHQADPELEPSAETPVDVDVPLGDSLDLHGLPPREVGDIVDAYVEEAHRLGFRRIRIIHGRGIGALRQTVRVHLERHPLVLQHADAPPPSGHGATVAELRGPEDSVATRRDTH